VQAGLDAELQIVHGHRFPQIAERAERLRAPADRPARNSRKNSAGMKCITISPKVSQQPAAALRRGD